MDARIESGKSVSWRILLVTDPLTLIAGRFDHRFNRLVSVMIFLFSCLGPPLVDWDGVLLRTHARTSTSAYLPIPLSLTYFHFVLAALLHICNTGYPRNAIDDGNDISDMQRPHIFPKSSVK